MSPVFITSLCSFHKLSLLINTKIEYIGDELKFTAQLFLNPGKIFQKYFPSMLKKFIWSKTSRFLHTGFTLMQNIKCILTLYFYIFGKEDKILKKVVFLPWRCCEIIKREVFSPESNESHDFFVIVHPSNLAVLATNTSIGNILNLFRSEAFSRDHVQCLLIMAILAL